MCSLESTINFTFFWVDHFWIDHFWVDIFYWVDILGRPFFGVDRFWVDLLWVDHFWVDLLRSTIVGSTFFWVDILNFYLDPGRLRTLENTNLKPTVTVYAILCHHLTLNDKALPGRLLFDYFYRYFYRYFNQVILTVTFNGKSNG